MVGNFSFTALLLNALLVLCLVSRTSAQWPSNRTSGFPCLDPADRKPESQLRNLTFPSLEESLSVGLMGHRSPPDLLSFYIARILIPEVLGYNIIPGVSDNSKSFLYIVAGCDCGGASCDQPDCTKSVSSIPTVQFGFGAWTSSWDAFLADLERQGDKLVPPDIVETQGWRSYTGVFIMNESRHEAMAETGIALEYYKGFWHESVNASRFFLDLDDFDDSDIRLCSDLPHWSGDDGRQIIEHYSAEAYMPIGSDGNVNVTCYKDRWWLAPACRADPHSCIPVILPALGMGLTENAMKAIAYNLPWAIAFVSQFFGKINKYRGRLLTFGWYPEQRFVPFRPSRIIFPTYQSDQWERGDRKTMAADLESHIIVNPKVKRSPEGNYLTKFLRNVKFSSDQVDAVLAHFNDEHARLAQTVGTDMNHTMSVMGCDWVRSNRHVWEAWIPRKNLCDVGSGLIIDVADSQSFTLDLSLGTDCVYCSSGRYSVPRTFQDGSLTHVCQPCPKGQEQVTAAESSCTPCTVGKYKDQDGPQLCRECEKGNHSDTTGQTACTPCEVGKSAPRSGMAECSECMPAEFADGTGKVSCDFCSEGTFSSEAGAPLCTECTSVLPGSTSGRASGSSAQCVCPAGTFLKASEGCVACLEGLSCAGGQDAPRQLEGYWVDISDPSLNQTQDYLVYRCRTPKECPDGPMGSCAAGREGIACNNCKNYHYPTDGGTCGECDGASTTVPVVIFLVLVPMVCVGLVLFMTLDVTKQHLTTVTAFSVFGQVIYAVQMLAAMDLIEIELPDPLDGMLELLGPLLLDLEMLRLPCVLGSDRPVIKFVLQLLVIPGFILLLMSIWAIGRKLGRTITYEHLFNLNGQVAFVAYIPLAVSMMLPFQCRSNPGGFTSMKSDPGLECFVHSEHITLVSLSVVGTILYPIGIAAWLTYVTLKFKSWVHSPHGIRRLTTCYGFLFARFKSEAYFFGLLFMFRNLCLSAIPVFLVEFPTMQILAMLLVLVIGALGQAHLLPWRTVAANQVDEVLNVVLLLLVGGVGTLIKGSQEVVEELLSILLTVLVIVSITGAFCVAIHAVKRRLWAGKAFDVFLCHHKSGAGSLCRLMKIMMESSSSLAVFLDSDHLNDLDLLFDTVRADIGHLIVVLSQSVLSRPWCSGEIVTAYRNDVHIVPLLCQGFIAPEQTDLQQIIDDWTSDEIAVLFGHGISESDILEAYTHLLDLPRLSMPLFQGLSQKEVVLKDLVSQCQANSFTLFSQSLREDKPQAPAVAVVGAVGDAEALASCEIMKLLLQKGLEVEVSVVHDKLEAEAFAPQLKLLLVLLSRGLLQDTAFAKTVYTICNHPDASPHILTAVADPSFQFPSSDILVDIEERGLGVEGVGPHEGPLLASTYNRMLSVLARPFTPLASDQAICAQVAELASRARPLLQSRGENVRSLSSSWSQKKLSRASRSITPKRSNDTGKMVQLEWV